MMELGLSLGDAASRSAAPSYGFVKEGDPRGREKVNAGSGNPKKRGLGFCMALAIGSSSPPPPESHQKQEQNEIHGDDDDDQRVSPELHLLPLRPPPEGGLRGFDVNRFPPPANTRYPPEEDESGAAAGAATSPSGNSAATTTSFPHQMDFFRSFDPKVGSGAHTTATTTNNNNNKRVAAAMRGGSSSSEAADTADTAAPAACSSRGVSDEEDHNGLMSGNSQKKLRLSKEQAGFLEDSFKHHTTLTPKQKLALAKQLDLRPRQVEVWFQNRRARTKLKQTEVDCEYLKRCCETLTEENRRLHKEVQELRALKSTPNFDVSNPFSMHLPATTLTMCPSCERTSAAAATAATTSATTNVASKSNAFSPGTRLRLH